MTYDQLKTLKPSDFKRFCGIHQKTFERMVEILTPQLERSGKRGGQAKLNVADQLLIALSDWREYRTYFHIAQSWGIHESTVCRIVRKVENLLLKSGVFRLPGKKQLSHPAYDWKVLVIDVTESPIERPKKNKDVTTVARKSDIP